MGRKKKAPTDRLSLRLPAPDLKEWREQAQKAGLSLAEYVSRRVTLRPLTAKKRKYSEVLAEQEAAQDAQERPGCVSEVEDDDVDDLSPEEPAEWAKTDPVLMREDAKWAAREAEWQARLERERREAQARDRRNRANGLAHRAGGASCWFSLMTPEQHAEWGDLEADMLRCERIAIARAEWHLPQPAPTITPAPPPVPSQAMVDGTTIKADKRIRLQREEEERAKDLLDKTGIIL